MPFLLKADLYPAILSDELNEITRSDDTLVTSALDAAVAEMRTYLYDSFDVDAIFTATGSARHALLVQLGADMAIYFLVARLQAGQDLSDRKARYDRAVAWLRQTQKSETYADLPRRTENVQSPFEYGSKTKRGNYF